MRLAPRVDLIEPFFVMEVAKRAAEVARARGPGAPAMLHLNIGEPAETASAAVQAAAHQAIREGRTAYTDATGLPELRLALSRWYADRHGLDIDPGRIVVTAGASAALQLACLALVAPGDQVICADPSYPCNRHFITVAGGTPQLVTTSAAERFQLSENAVRAHWSARTAGVLLASPSNPTGTSVDPAEMARIVQLARSLGGWAIVDEIYLGLCYDRRYARSALHHDEQVVSVNSFSKYFGMTGWRLGWLVLPPEVVPAVERLAQNLYICPSTVAQRAALACFEAESLREFDRRCGEFERRRDFLVPALDRLGWPVPVVPDGAFYAWVDAGGRGQDSWQTCLELIDRAGVVVAPGRDFGPAWADRFLRFSYASSMTVLQEAVARLERMTPAGGPGT